MAVFRNEVEQSLKTLQGFTVYEGHGRFVSEKKVEVNGSELAADQIFINVGMTIGIAPVTGIPLPFVSFGGSSMITTLTMIGLLEAIHVRGKLAGRK